MRKVTDDFTPRSYYKKAMTYADKLSQPRANLATLIADFDKHAHDVAIVATRGVRQQHVTYSQLAGLARRFGAELERRGIAKGERVVLWGENSAEWVAAFFGCVMRGVVPVPVDFAGSVAFVKRVLAEVSPKLVSGQRRENGAGGFGVSAFDV